MATENPDLMSNLDRGLQPDFGQIPVPFVLMALFNSAGPADSIEVVKYLPGEKLRLAEAIRILEDLHEQQQEPGEVVVGTVLGRTLNIRLPFASGVETPAGVVSLKDYEQVNGLWMKDFMGGRTPHDVATRLIGVMQTPRGSGTGPSYLTGVTETMTAMMREPQELNRDLVVVKLTPTQVLQTLAERAPFDDEEPGLLEEYEDLIPAWGPITETDLDISLIEFGPQGPIYIVGNRFLNGVQLVDLGNGSTLVDLSSYNSAFDRPRPGYGQVVLADRLLRGGTGRIPNRLYVLVSNLADSSREKRRILGSLERSDSPIQPWFRLPRETRTAYLRTIAKAAPNLHSVLELEPFIRGDAKGQGAGSSLAEFPLGGPIEYARPTVIDEAGKRLGADRYGARAGSEVPRI